LVALRGNKEHFVEELFALKPHPGQIQAAALIRKDLSCRDQSILKPTRVQERYSFRCAPHVIGVLYDALPWMKCHIEVELNSVNDNPIIDADNESIYHGGHFYGGHIAFAMDSLKNLLANQADLLDRQMAILINEKSNNGLKANLSGATGPYAKANHGLKAVQIAVSSFSAEAQKLTMPASVFSRSTECHNQDKVSMGTHSARDCSRVAEILEQVSACVLYAATQGIYLRVQAGEFTLDGISPSLKGLVEQVHSCIPPLESDRELESGLRNLMHMISTQSLNLESH
jgi:histidine ammonia-lyase